MTENCIHQNITALPPTWDVLYVTLFCQHQLSQIILFEEHLLNPFTFETATVFYEDTQQ